ARHGLLELLAKGDRPQYSTTRMLPRTPSVRSLHHLTSGLTPVFRAGGSIFMSEDRIPPPRPRCRRLMGVRVLGTGSYVPDAVVSNDHLHQRFGFASAWIVKRTGILERRHALPHQATSDLCHEAALRCLESSGVAPRDIDLIVLATFTPDMSFPSTACLLQDRLKLS